MTILGTPTNNLYPLQSGYWEHNYFQTWISFRALYTLLQFFPWPPGRLAHASTNLYLAKAQGDPPQIPTLLLSALFFLLWYSASWILATLASPNSDFCLLGSVRQLFPLSTAVWKTPWGVRRDDHRAALYSLLSGIMVPNNLFSSV